MNKVETLSPSDLEQMFQAEAYGAALEASFARRYPHPIERAAMLGKHYQPDSIVLVHEIRLQRLLVLQDDLETLNSLRWQYRVEDEVFYFQKAPITMGSVHSIFGQLWNSPAPRMHGPSRRVHCDCSGIGNLTAVQFIGLIASKVRLTKLPVVVVSSGDHRKPKQDLDARPIPDPRFRELEASLVETKAQLSALRRAVNASDEMPGDTLTKAERVAQRSYYEKDRGGDRHYASDWWKPA